MNVIAKVHLPHADWKPRPHQKNLWRYLMRGGKRAVAVWHRRAGKDEICMHATAMAMMDRPGNYWHCLPEFAQGRKAIWDSVNPHTGRRRIDEAFPHEMRSATLETTCKSVSINQSTWQRHWFRLRLLRRRHRKFNSRNCVLRIRPRQPKRVGLLPADPRGEQRLGGVHLYSPRTQSFILPVSACISNPRMVRRTPHRRRYWRSLTRGSCRNLKRDMLRCMARTWARRCTRRK